MGPSFPTGEVRAPASGTGGRVRCQLEGCHRAWGSAGDQAREWPTGQLVADFWPLWPFVRGQIGLSHPLQWEDWGQKREPESHSRPRWVAKQLWFLSSVHTPSCLWIATLVELATASPWGGGRDCSPPGQDTPEASLLSHHPHPSSLGLPGLRLTVWLYSHTYRTHRGTTCHKPPQPRFPKLSAGKAQMDAPPVAS